MHRPDPLDALQNTEDPAFVSFESNHPEVELAPVCVLIPAYEEEGNIASVLDLVPDEVCGLATSCLVVVDGGSDRTGEVAEEHGALVCRSTTNRGQGAALRLGYRIALQHNARYVVTIDADGQWDPREMEQLVMPLVSGQAEMVQGSRRLGAALNGDVVRAAGVVTFSWLVRLLTGCSVTDTSSGFRALSADALPVLTLRQDQYQASELLIELIGRGMRVLERPVTMTARRSGHSKKGNNLVYGARYAWAILSTWWRVRSSQKETAKP